MNQTELLAEEELAKKFIKKWFWLYLFTFLSAPLWYIIKIILTRDLTMNDYGLFQWIISLLVLLAALNDLAGTENLNYFLPKFFINKEYGKAKYLLLFVFKLQICVSLIMMGSLYFASDWLATHHFKDANAGHILRIFSLFFLGTNLLHICVALFSATQNTKLQKASDFIRTASSVILIFWIFIFEWWSLEAYSWGWIGWLFIAILFAGWNFYKNYYKIFLAKIPREFDLDLRKSFIKYAIPVFLTANISLLLSQIDSQIVTAYLGNKSQAIYSNYLSIFSIPFLILSPFLGFLFPVFTELNARGNTEKFKMLYSVILSTLVVLSIWITAYFFQSGENFAILFFGNAYQESGVILKYCVPFVVFNLVNSLNFQVLAWTGKAWTRTLTFAVALPINILLSIYLIQILGLEWSALAVGLSWIPMCVMTTFATRKYLQFPKMWLIFINTGSVILSFFLSQFFVKIFAPNSLILQIIICTGIYLIFFLASNFYHLKETLTLLKKNR